MLHIYLHMETSLGDTWVWKTGPWCLSHIMSSCIQSSGEKNTINTIYTFLCLDQFFPYAKLKLLTVTFIPWILKKLPLRKHLSKYAINSMKWKQKCSHSEKPISWMYSAREFRVCMGNKTKFDKRKSGKVLLIWRLWTLHKSFGRSSIIISVPEKKIQEE